MTTHPNIQLVRDYLDAAGRRDMAAAAEFFSDDFVYVVQGDNPLAGTRRGQTAALDYFGEMVGHSRGSYRIDEEVDWLVSDRRVLLIADESMTIGDNGHSWTRYVLFSVANGRFVEVRLFEDDQRAFDAAWATAAAGPAKAD